MDKGIHTQSNLRNFQIESEQSDNKPKAVSFCQLFRFADCTDYLLMTAGSVASCCMGAAFPVFAFLTGNMIDSFEDQQNILDQSTKNLYFYIGLGGLSLVIGLVMFYSWTIVGEKQAIKCRKEYFRSLLRQEIAWFDMQKQAALATDFEADSMTFQMAVGQKISTILMVLSMLLVGIGLSLYIGWILTLVMLGYIPIVILIWTKNIAVKVQTEREEENIFRQSDSKTQQTLGAIKLVKQMNAEHFQSSIQQTILNKIKNIYQSTILKYTLASSVAVLSLGFTFPLIFWYGSQCVFDTKLCPQSVSTRTYTAGSVAQILYALLLPAISLNQLAPCIEKIAEGKSAANRIFAMIDRVPLIQSKPNAIVPTQFKGQIEFVGVSFAYPKYKDKKILDGLYMKIDCRHSALVGASGCGKSTIFQLIMRFYDPDEGAVYLDGVDLRDLNLEWLRSKIGYITQQPILFATSIKQNLLLGKADATDEELDTALKKAQAYDFVHQLKDKADTFVGSGGSQLSGGQKQRIAIARALLKGSELLLMDEATSALDRINQAQILNNLKQGHENFRSVSITHRKRVLTECDKVYIFQNGKIKKVTHSKKQNSQSHIRSSNILLTKGSAAQGTTEYQSIVPTRMDQTQKILEPIHEKQALQEEDVNIAKDKVEESDDPRLSLSRIFTYFTKQKCLLVSGTICSLLDGLCFPTFGIIAARILSEMIYYQNIPNYDNSEVRTWYLIAIGIAVADATFNTLSLLFFGLLSKNTVDRLRHQTFNKVIRMPITWFEHQENSPEKITSDITMNCKALYIFCKLFMPHLLLVIVNLLFSLIGSVIFEWRTGLTSIALIPLIIISQAIQLGFVQGYTESKNKIYSGSVRTIKESVMNIRTVLALNATQAKSRQYSNQLSEVISVMKGKAFLSGFMYGLGSFLQFVSFALIFFLASVYVKNFDLSIEGPLQSIFLIIFAGITAGNNSNFMPDISKAKMAARNLFYLIDLEDQFERRIKNGSKGVTQAIVGNIQFKNVGFKYESRDEMALNDFNLKIRPGENVGIVGTSGCGKSTLFSLLQGFYSPTQGQIMLEGIDINDYDLHHLRSSFGVVSQQPMLFNESIGWNIRYNLTNASDKDMVWAAKAANYYPKEQQIRQSLNNANVDDSVSVIKGNTSELGHFQKNVGPKGSHVSGGQKQRIAIARAILRQPKVLLLDQATSALDPDSQLIVQSSLENIMKGKTTLGITHRLEQVKQSERVVVINEGRVKEDGSFRQLSTRQDGHFFNLLNGYNLRVSKA